MALPTLLERRYGVYVHDIVTLVHNAAVSTFDSHILSQWRVDQGPEELSESLVGTELLGIMATLGISFEDIVNPKRLRQVLRVVAQSNDSYVKQQLSNALGRRVNVDVDAEIDAWVEAQATTISRLVDRWIAEVGEELDETEEPDTLTFEQVALGLARRKSEVARNAFLGATAGLLLLNSALTTANAVGEGLTNYIWVTEGDEKVRPHHADLEGTVQSFLAPPIGGGTEDGDPGNPGSGINCFPGEVLVKGFPSIDKMFRTRYRGELAVIKVGDNDTSFRVTPNHPMLTSVGWKAAGDLQIGDKLVDISSNGFQISEPDKDSGISFEDLFVALSESGSSETSVASDFDFYGDATADEDIDIVTPNWELLLDRIPSFAQAFDQPLFSISHMRLADMAASGSLSHLGGAPFLTAQRGMGRFSEPLSLLRKHARHAKSVGLTAATEGQLMLFEDTNNGPSRSADSPSNLKDADSRTVEAQNVFVTVSDLVVDDFDGHVYTLQTKSGWYHTDVVTANCRCVADIILPGQR